LKWTYSPILRNATLDGDAWNHPWVEKITQVVPMDPSAAGYVSPAVRLLRRFCREAGSDAAMCGRLKAIGLGFNFDEVCTSTVCEEVKETRERKGAQSSALGQILGRRDICLLTRMLDPPRAGCLTDKNNTHAKARATHLTSMHYK